MTNKKPAPKSVAKRAKSGATKSERAPAPTKSALGRELAKIWNARGVAQGANLSAWRLNMRDELVADAGAKRAANIEQKRETWLNALRPKDYVFWGRQAAQINPRAPFKAPDWYRERASELENGKALVAAYGQLDEADRITFPLVDFIERTAESARLEAAVAILRRVGRERLAQFMERFGVDAAGGIGEAAANENWGAVAQMFLREAA
jgi:hypothetical protein